MGCYGIGVSHRWRRHRTGARRPRHRFPAAIAPFAVCIVPMGYAKGEAVKAAADSLYSGCARPASTSFSMTATSAPA